ncbi:MAG TPA: DUF134 domain-containing protein [Candidatus Altiarchaeales archaeon]|nr:MAG: hypothetical protein DRO65_01065 [Candidatus Altiarchaeales archaeon]HDN83480.1 DUF134 domain-containing protein [Candidatus Altiarchaeales archaeon]
MPRWRWCFRYRGPGRPKSPLFLSSLPEVRGFFPDPCLNSEPIKLTYPEYEALKLVDLQGLTQEDAAKKMNTSRGTIWRLLESARKKIAKALVESRPLLISQEGDVEKL